MSNLLGAGELGVITRNHRRSGSPTLVVGSHVIVKGEKDGEYEVQPYQKGGTVPGKKASWIPSSHVGELWPQDRVVLEI